MLATLSCSRFCVRCTRRSEHAACEAHHETRVAQHTTFVMACGMLCTAPAACAAQAHGLSIRRALCGCAAEALRVYRACAAGRRCTAVAFAEQLRAAVADAAERSRCEHTVSAPSMAISGVFAVGRCSRRSRCAACRWHATAAAGAGVWWESCLDVTCGWECMRLCLAVRVLVFGCVRDGATDHSALALRCTHRIQGLDLSGCSLTAASLSAICAGLPLLTELHIASCYEVGRAYTHSFSLPLALSALSRSQCPSAPFRAGTCTAVRSLECALQPQRCSLSASRVAFAFAFCSGSAPKG